MNWLQKLLGIDKIVEALSKPQKQQSSEADELRKQLEAALNRAQQAESAHQQLQQSVANKTDDKASAAVITQLTQEVENLKAALSDPEKALQAYFLSLVDSNKEEGKKGPGRPKIHSKRINFHLDLDLAIILEHLAQAQNAPLTRVINDAIREWTIAHHAHLLDALANVQDQKVTPLP